MTTACPRSVRVSSSRTDSIGGYSTVLTAAPFDRHMPINRGMTYEQMLDAVET